mmetsp:Transcript_16693/g.51839  ORF Transcript_16693/g.51839 Transcript_16693/m.51839 type:complete len:271 (+) Transcript_16693:376-1188(+)
MSRRGLPAAWCNTTFVADRPSADRQPTPTNAQTLPLWVPRERRCLPPAIHREHRARLTAPSRVPSLLFADRPFRSMWTPDLPRAGVLFFFSVLRFVPYLPHPTPRKTACASTRAERTRRRRRHTRAPPPALGPRCPSPRALRARRDTLKRVLLREDTTPCSRVRTLWPSSHRGVGTAVGGCVGNVDTAGLFWTLRDVRRGFPHPVHFVRMYPADAQRPATASAYGRGFRSGALSAVLAGAPVQPRWRVPLLAGFETMYDGGLRGGHPTCD